MAVNCRYTSQPSELGSGAWLGLSHLIGPTSKVEMVPVNVNETGDAHGGKPVGGLAMRFHQNKTGPEPSRFVNHILYQPELCLQQAT